MMKRRGHESIGVFCQFISAVLFCCIVFYPVLSTGQSAPIVLENGYFKYTIGGDGTNISFIDKKTGTDYFDRSESSSFARIETRAKEYSASSVSYEGNLITVRFDEPGIKIIFKTSVQPEGVFLEIASIEGDGVVSLSFLNVPLTLKGMPDDPFAACVLSLNLQTRVRQMPALQSRLDAECYARFGIRGGKIALIGVPQAEILPTIKQIMSNAEEIPRSTVGGAWAKDVPENFGSSIFDMGTLTTKTVDGWIGMVKNLGFKHIQNHGGRGSFRFGDFKLRPEKWPNGWDDFKAINDRLHQAGINSIFHTYAFFIDKSSKYVTPVPSKELGAIRTFTLAASLDESTTEIRVNEPTGEVLTVTGFGIRNSMTLHIGDELITFSGASKEPPYTFTGCTRGAYGTKTASHSKAAQARHLTECFGLFAPAPDTKLFDEIARLHAEIVDYAGFDGIYLDAIDGADVVDGRENAWYYGTKFVFEIMKNLKKPVGIEYSAMYHHWWHFRPRWQAWDFPTKGQKCFVDIHVDQINRGLLLPLHLGWWSLQRWNPPQIEPSYPDVIEYLGCKLIGHNACITTFMNVSKPDTLAKVPLFKRAVGMLKQYEDLRLSNYFDESVKSRLREPGKEFTLFKDSGEKWRFKPIHYDGHKVEGMNHRSSTWQARNPFSAQPAKLRIEALMSAGSYDDPGNIIIEDFTAPKNFQDKSSAEGITSDIQAASDQVRSGGVSGKFTALNGGDAAQQGAYISLGKTFEPWINLGKHQALGVWVYGDGQGELINFRIMSPRHIARGIADHYVIVDFTGWRYFELIETEGTRHADYNWPEGDARYAIFRETANYNSVETFALMYNNLPPGKQVTCYISPIKALPMVPITIKNPAVVINGERIVFPIEMESGSYLEYNSDSDCILYGPRGEVLANVKPQGEAPALNSGANQASFDCDGTSNVSIRAKVTITSTGEAL